MKDMFNLAPRAAPVGNNANLHDVEEEEDDYLAWTYPEAVPPATTARDWTPAGGETGGDADNPWDGYEAPPQLEEGPIKVNIIKGEEIWECPTHGATCNPGICKVRARVEAERRRKKEHDEREEKKRIRMENKKRRDEKEARRRARAEGRDVSSHDLPPHLAPYPYRGAGSGSGSGSGSDSDSDTESKDNNSGASIATCKD
jgi:hypothetical protein